MAASPVRLASCTPEGWSAEKMCTTAPAFSARSESRTIRLRSSTSKQRKSESLIRSVSIAFNSHAFSTYVIQHFNSRTCKLRKM